MTVLPLTAPIKESAEVNNLVEFHWPYKGGRDVPINITSLVKLYQGCCVQRASIHHFLCWERKDHSQWNCLIAFQVILQITWPSSSTSHQDNYFHFRTSPEEDRCTSFWLFKTNVTNLINIPLRWIVLTKLNCSQWWGESPIESWLGQDVVLVPMGHNAPLEFHLHLNIGVVLLQFKIWVE